MKRSALSGLLVRFFGLLNMLQDYYNKASKIKKLLIKFAILYGVFLTTAYLLFRAYYINFNLVLAPFSILLFSAEVHTIILLYGMFYSLWPRKYKVYESENNHKNLQINIFIPVAGEPTEVIKETILHAKKAADFYDQKARPNLYPRVIVLNDGRGRGSENWEEVRDLCAKIGVNHIAREKNTGYKAGNINNGLKEFPADDPHNAIDCFFDADFCAKENFLIEILKPLADENVDFVQSPQRYKNLKTWVAKAAGAHQIFFFDYICPAKAYDNALFLCGTNYAIRREALLDADGVENRFVTEDYATSIKLHLIGKKGVFISKVLALGMAPMNLKEYFNQQTRWCKGCLDANGAYLKELVFGPLTWRQKFHYFISTVYYFIGVRDAILVLAPIPYLFFGTSLIRATSVEYVVWVYLPLLFYNFIMFFLTFRDPVKSLVLDVVAFPVFALAFISSVIKKNLPFSVTIKKYERENPFQVYRIQLLVALVLVAGLIYSSVTKVNVNPYGKFINHFWATYSASFLMIGFYLVVKENYSFVERITKSVKSVFEYKVEIGRTLRLNPYAFSFGVLAGLIILGFGYRNMTPIVAAAQNTVERVQNINKNDTLKVPEGGIYYGYYLPELNSHSEIISFGVVKGEKPSLIMYYQDWNEKSKFDTKFMRNFYENNMIPVVTWEPYDASNSETDLNVNGKTAEVVLSGEYDHYIRDWARAAAHFNKPLFLRFAHEMNGNWYPWGNLSEGDADKYKAMWRYVHNIFEEEKADNVIWLWSPNNTNHYGEIDDLLSFYPGSDYVDWVGFSAFNWGTTYEQNNWGDFKYISWKSYEKLTDLGKPIMVAETSSVSYGGNKAEWFADTFGKDIKEMPYIKAVILFNKNFKDADFKLDSGMDVEKVIKKNIVEDGYYLKYPVIEKQ